MLSSYRGHEVSAYHLLVRSVLIAGAYGLFAGLTFLYLPDIFEALKLKNNMTAEICLWFGVSVFFYSIHLMFVGFWSSINWGWIAFLAQVPWAVSMLCGAVVMEQTSSLAVCFAIGSIGQVAVDIFGVCAIRKGDHADKC
jgi:hypothetical protein